MLRTALVLLLTVFVFSTKAQISEFGIANAKINQKKSERTRENSQTPLQLPFWDDFSTSGLSPDTLRWQNSDAILINDGLGQNAPSLGIASFDGIRADGLGYSANASSTGKTDSLTSCPIALESRSSSDNVFFSFYYQPGGNGDSPDASDSIRVEFLNSQNQWVNVWPLDQVLSQDEDRFEKVIIQVSDTGFFHDNFRFRFQSFGRQSGSFDIWNIDYVYLNDEESANLSFPDRTISAPLSPIFGEYYNVPARHFRNEIVSNPSFLVGSVDDPSDPPQPYAFTGQVGLIARQNGVESTEDLTLGPFTNRQIFPGQFNEEVVSIFADEVTIPENQDSVTVDLEFVLNASDNVLPGANSTGDFLPELYDSLDFRFNDTLRTSYLLGDYYAYDDGTAEQAAGLNFSGDQITYEFPLTKDTSDFVFAVDMYFPFVGTEPSGKVVDVIILQDLRSEPTSVLYTERVTLGRTETPNEFIRYELRRSTVVTDSFYIGYRQVTEGRLGIGLDKSNDSGDRMFFNLDGIWRQNQSVRGSLMLRPVFGEEKIVTSLDNPRLAETETIRVYPNPSKGQFRVEGKFEEVIIYDIQGRQIMNQVNIQGQRSLNIDISDQPNGLYILKALQQGNSNTIKLIKD
ncbi:MAG: T9SS type A sorting domain-containing protein [Bacteroidota bacterium]